MDFSQPVPLYVDNFLDFPVGGIAPVGWYDYTSATWIASDNGRVIQIININNGLADIDLEGNGQAASASALAELGITQAERQQLSHLYTPGKTLWRVPIPHFSPWDINWPVSPPPDASRPNPPEPKTLDDDIPDKRCEQAGCIIEAESQVLGERLPIIGTPLSLNYRSHRVVGRKSAYTLNIPLQGDSVPKSLKEIRLRISVASRRFESRFSPTTRQTLFVWDGIDGYGRPVQGTQEARIEITYVYRARYGLPPEGQRSFARAGQMILVGRRRVDFLISKTFTKEVGLWTPASVGLGYLSLDIHHSYDPINKILYQGSGGQRTAPASINGIIETVVGNGRAGFSGDGKLATEARLDYPHDTAVGPDGSLYIVDMMKERVRRVGTDNIITTVAGNGKDKSSDTVAGREATEIALGRPYSIAIGPDGLLYIADRVRRLVFRLDSDGMLTPVVGNGSSKYNGDGSLALETGIEADKIAFGPDGRLYILSMGYYGFVRRIDENGIITTIAGSNNWRDIGDGDPATQAHLNSPWDMTFCPDGNLYIADSGNHRIRLVDLQGMISTVAGNGEYGSSGDGGPALDAKVESPMAITCGSDGIYFVERWGKQIRRIGWDGIINTVIGDPYRSGTGDGSPASEAKLKGVAGIRFGPDGSLYIADAYDHRVRRVGMSFPGFSMDNIILPSEDGGQVYEFSPEGRHLRTFDSITGQMLYQFAYNDNGYLSQITDLDGDITRIERNGNTPVAIIAPDGQRTALTLDEKGYLNSVTNPASEAYQLQYTTDGLLTAFIDPRGHKSVYQYDDLGRFVEDTNAAGGGWTLARSENQGGGYTTTMTTKEGRVTQYQVKPQSNGEMLRVNTSPDGTVNKTFINAEGETTVTRPDGTVIVSSQGPDPRFGMQAPFTSLLTITTPNGLTGVITTEKTAKLAEAGDPLSLLSLTTQITSNDRTSESVYDATNKTVTAQSAAGSKSVSIFDDKGRVIRKQVPGLVDVFYTYDNRGRLTQVTEGEGDEARTSTLSYDGKGYLEKLTDAVGRYTQFHYDAVGRVTTQILPDSREINYRYDANGNVTAFTPPSRPVHGFEYTKVDLQKQYTPPTLTGLEQPQTQYAYNLDKQLVKIQRPDGQVIDFVYDVQKKRLNSINLPGEQSVSYAYDDSTGKLKTLTAPDGSTLSYTYDGSLPLSETWGNGEITGTLSLSYDNHFQVTTLSLNGNAVNYEYDADGQISKAGDLGLTHNGQNGLFTGTQLGNITTQRAHNTFGEMASETASYNSNTLYRTEYQRDQLGRITQKVETLEGIATTFNYRYDVAGRLIEVKQDAVVVEAYTYDDNGNRLSAYTTHSSVKGQYDNQDRLTQYGDNTYDYTENGELRRKNSNGEMTQYRYDVLGNLQTIQLPDGKQIEYVIDGRNRRIGKKLNGQLVQAFLYQGSLNPVAELDANGNVVSRFIYGSKANIPDYMLKDGKTYRILSDHLGSPRLVVDISEGTVAQRMDYDAFGNVVFDSNPGFQPFGFAGGIYDLDTQLTRFGARDYDAQTGRWTAKDPILFAGGDTNLYGYVLGDPINFIDPFGEYGLAGAAYGFVSGAIGGYISGGLAGAILGGLAGAIVGLVNPWGSHAAGAFIGNAIASLAGQISGNYLAGKCVTNSNNYSVGAAVGAGIGGVIGVKLGFTIRKYGGVLDFRVKGSDLMRHTASRAPEDVVASVAEGLSVGVGEFSGNLVFPAPGEGDNCPCP